jgi:hypothetical protein
MFDPRAFTDDCVSARVADIEFYTKSSLGHCFFPYRGRPCVRD